MKRINKIGSFALALLLLGGSIGATVHTHYCMGEIKDVALNGIAEACAMDKMVEEKGVESMCCSETLEEYQLDDLNKVSFSYEPPVLHAQEIQLLELAIVQSHDLLVKSPKYLFYKPPLIYLDIPIQVQSFLI